MEPATETEKRGTNKSEGKPRDSSIWRAKEKECFQEEKASGAYKELSLTDISQKVFVLEEWPIGLG